MKDDQLDGAELRAHLVAARADEIRQHAEAAEPDEVVLVLDTRDLLAAALAAKLLTPSARTEEEHATEQTGAAGLVGRFTEQHADAGEIPILTITTKRSALADDLEADDWLEQASALAAADGPCLVVVASDGVDVLTWPGASR